MPQVVWELMGALRDENTTPRKLETIIESDSALASKVLGLANSAYYGLAQKVTTVERAIIFIGFQELEMLALGAGLADTFDLSRAPKGFDGEGLWIHSLAVGWAARELARKASYPTPGEAMIAGVLHDLGKLVLATHMVDDFNRITDLTTKGQPYYLAEKEVSASHAQIGFWLTKRWGLPDILSTAILEHHRLNEFSMHLELTGLIHLADYLIKRINVGLVQQAEPLKAAQALEYTGLSREAVKEVADEAEKKAPIMLEPWRRLLKK